ncbi:MAG: hypothetical protein VKS61_14940 [Candidatus Sericytochromatia bacterium]|nr:hypothetical protein [Candidatus Sericytochromatia bacterium]
MSATLLQIASSLAWAAFDAARKALGQRLSPVPLLVGLCAGHTLPLGAWLAWQGLPPVGPGYMAPAAASIAVMALGVWVLLH